MRQAMSATQAGARERAWTISTCSAMMRRARRRALKSIESGFLAAAGNGVSTPPTACNSLVRRPPSDATSARAPAATSAAAISIVVRSAPPASMCGIICRTVRPESSARIPRP